MMNIIYSRPTSLHWQMIAVLGENLKSPAPQSNDDDDDDDNDDDDDDDDNKYYYYYHYL